MRSKYPGLTRPTAVLIALALIATLLAIVIPTTIGSAVNEEWANAVVEEATERVVNPDNALGPNDGTCATMRRSAELTLDMGVGEEALDGPGNDLKVYSQGGDYEVFVWDGFTWQSLGIGAGTQEFDLADAGVAQSRYVRIENRTKGDICIDAVEVLGGEPKPRITAPGYEADLTGNTQIVAEDEDDGNITDCWFYYWYDLDQDCVADEGEDTWHLIGHDSVGGNWSVWWDTGNYSDCCYILKAVMENSRGIQGDSYEQGFPHNVQLTNHDPQPEITAPDDQTPCDAAPVSGNVTLTAVDNSFEQGADVTECTFEYYYDENMNCDDDDGNQWADIAGMGASGVVKGNGGEGYEFTYDWDTSQMPDCCYLLRVTMEDKHGRANTTDHINIALSNHDPQPVFLNPGEDDTVQGTILLEVEDASLDQGSDVICTTWEYCYATDESQCSGDDWNLILQDCDPVGDTWRLWWDTNQVQDCFYTIRATMEDEHGRIGVSYLHVGVGNDPPVVEIEQPYNNDLLCEDNPVSGNVTVRAKDTQQATDIEAATFRYYYDTNQDCVANDGNSWVQFGYDGTKEMVGGNATFEVNWDTSQLNDCCYIVRVYISDLHALNGYDTLCVALTNHNPVPEITQPEGNTTISGTQRIIAQDTGFDLGNDINLPGHGNVTFEYATADQNCQQVGQWTDMGATVTQVGSPPDRTWYVDWDTTQVEDCFHLIRVTLEDKHGRTGTTAICVGVANNPPQPRMTAPPDATPCTAGEVSGNIDLVAVDDKANSTVQSCVFEIWDDFNQNCTADEGNTTWVAIGSGTLSAGNWTLDWDTTDVPDECYLVRANMTDIHGLGNVSTHINLYVNNLRPAPYFWYPYDRSDYPVGDPVNLYVYDKTGATDIHDADVYFEWWDPVAREWVYIGTGTSYYESSMGMWMWYNYNLYYPDRDWIAVRVTMTDKGATPQSGDDIVQIYRVQE